MAIKASAKTVLQFGLASAPVALYKTTGDPEKLAPFEKAGPHGARLERVPVTRKPDEDLGRRLQGGVPNPPAAEVKDDPTEASLHGSPSLSAPLPTSTLGVGTCEVGHDAELDSADVREGLFVPTDDGGERFVDLSEQLDAIREETQLDQMEVIAFIRRDQIQRFRIQGSYYLGADGPGASKVLALLDQAIHRLNRVPVVKWTKTSRQALGVITPGKRGTLDVIELAWAAQVRKPEEKQLTHRAVEVTEDEVAAACALAAALADESAVLNEQEDDRVRLERELRALVAEGKLEQFETPEHEEPPVEASLADVLRASVAARV